jgi:flavin reductase (DIM6/NTAB) family NADH-FMN oxidoreductase RutF
MKQWRCTICGYIHTGTEPPETCPECGAGPVFFEEVVVKAPEENAGRVGLDRPELQNIMFQIPCGLFMVSSCRDGRYNGMIDNTVFQITNTPLQLLLGMDKQHLTTEYIRNSKVFAINFLAPDQLSLVKRFGFQSGRETDKFSGIGWHVGVTGAPLLDEAPGYIECRVKEQTMDTGTHMVFLGEVVSGMMKPEATILSYQVYHQRKQELWDDIHG